jgi:hypothetical protein
MIQCLKSKEWISNESQGIPSYIISRLNIRYMSKLPKTLKLDSSEIDAAVNRFKIIKNLVQLLYYHNTLIPLNQYEGEDMVSNFFSFIKDIFN